MIRYIVLWILFSVAPASPFSKSQREETAIFVEQFYMQNRSSNEMMNFQRTLPCHQCKMVPSLNGESLMLITRNERDLEILKNFIQKNDSPVQQATITIYWILIQEHLLDDFLSFFLNPSALLKNSWKDLWKVFLGDLKGIGGAKVLASPTVVVTAGQELYLSSKEELSSHSSMLSQQARQLGFSMSLKCAVKGNDVFSLDIEMDHFVIPGDKSSLQHASKDKFKTYIEGQKGEYVFLGSLGRWSESSDQATFSLLGFLPQEWGLPFQKKISTTSQLVVVALIE